MLESLGMSFTTAERRGLLKMFDTNEDGRVSYKEFLSICNQHRGSRRGTRGIRGSSNSPTTSKQSRPSSTPRSTSQYQEYLSNMSTSGGMAARQKPSASKQRPSSATSSGSDRKNKAPPKSSRASTPAAPTPSNPQSPEEEEPKLSFGLEFTSVTEQRVQQMAKKAKRHCVQVRKELVILPANRRPRRAALLAASQKAEKYRQSWETLAKLIAAQSEGMVQETLAAMRACFITEDNLVAVVHELTNRFPMPAGEGEYEEGAGQAANSMGPLYATGSPAQGLLGGSGMAPGGEEGFFGEESDSTDSEDDMGDLRLLHLAQCM